MTPTFLQSRKKCRKQLKAAARLGESGKHDEAETIWRAYLETTPDDPDVLFNVGVCVMRRADSLPHGSKARSDTHYEAAEFFERVVACQNATMERKADAMNNLGLMVERFGDTEKAAIAWGFALKMFPSHNAARVNLGDAKRFFGDFEGAAREYNAVLDQDPDSPEARFCCGMIALLLGDFDRGWSEYRWRFKAPSFKGQPFVTDVPEWHGEDLNGKTLLMRSEQGWGDQIMCARFPAAIKARWPFCEVWYHCGAAMHRLFEGVYGLDRVVLHPADGYDYHVPIFDIPHWLGMKTDADIPEARCIRPMPSWSVWRLRDADVRRKRIALVWAGSPTHGKDRARSIPATMFEPLIDAHPEADFYSLQCGPSQPDVAKLKRVTDLSPQITDWTDTAQMLMCMDLLVSVDTACVHLAGTVGTPVYMLCPFSPDWRWQLKREDSPWYPKLRIFRQPAKDDWETPLQRIISEL